MVRFNDKDQIDNSDLDGLDIIPITDVDNGIVDKKIAMEQIADFSNESLEKGNLTESNSSVLNISNGTNSVIGSGTSIEVSECNISNDGYLSSENFINFNSAYDKINNLNIINVKDYGATGDGITDDTTAIQNAINACTDGQLLFLPAGEYVTSSITINKAYQNIVGAGAKNTQLLFQNGNGILIDGSLSPAYRTKINIKDLSVHGDYTDITIGTYGIKIYKSAEVSLHNIYIRGFDTGLYLEGALINQFYDVTIQQNNIGIFYSDLTSPTLNCNLNNYYTCKIINNFRQSFNYDGDGSCQLFSGCEIENNGTQTTVDTESTSGTSILYVTSTNNFVVGDTIAIDLGGGNYETAVIDTITDGVSLNLTSNLTNTQTVSTTVTLFLDQVYFNGNGITGNDVCATFISCWFESNKGKSDIYANGYSLNTSFNMYGTTFLSTQVYDTVNINNMHINILGSALAVPSIANKNIVLGATTRGQVIGRISSFTLDSSSLVTVENSSGILNCKDKRLSSDFLLKWFVNASQYHSLYNSGGYLYINSYINHDLILNGGLRLNNTIKINTGTGSPESVLTAPIGSLFLRTDGGTSTTLYVKESGAGNTGWVPVANISYTPEDVSNKETSALDTSTTKYPCNNVVKTAVDLKADASTSPEISSGSGAPSSTPAKIGDIYVDTTNHKLYFADGTSSSADWIIAN